MLKYIFVFCSFIFAQSYEDSVRLSGAVDDSVEETGTLLDTAKEERSVLDTEEVNTDTVENVPAKDYDETIVYENGDTLFENYQNGLLYHEILIHYHILSMIRILLIVIGMMLLEAYLQLLLKYIKI